MNHLTDSLLKTFQPRIAIVAYATSDGWQECYLESHEISKEGKLLEGKPLKQETLEGIVDIFFNERQNRVNIGGLIPENLLSFNILPGGHYEMIWYRPEEQRQLYFSETLKIPNGTAWVPELIYSVEKDRLSIYAIKNNNVRPGADVQLFNGPFHNVTGGSVCLGSAKVKKPTNKSYENLMKYWEDMFWLSEFTHLGGSENPTKSNLNILWKKIISKKLKWSSVDELTPLKNKKLSDLL
jgi:PRTRC genetic system protein B